MTEITYCARGCPRWNAHLVTLPHCSLCHAHGRETPLHHTAAGAWVCPICDRNIPHRLTRGQADRLLRRKDS